MHVKRIITALEAANLAATLNKAGKPLVIDIETTGLNSFKDELISVAVGAESTIYILPAKLAPALTLLETPLILHNFMFDYKFLFRKGIDLTGHDCRDTMLMHHLLDENLPHSLDSIIQARFQDPYKELFWAKFKAFQDAPVEEQDEYAAKDAHYTGLLYFQFKAELERDEVPETLIKQVHELAFALLDTEIHGVSIDLDKIRDLGIVNRIKSIALEGEMHEVCKQEIEAIENQLHEKEKAKRKTDKGKAAVKRPRFNFGSPSQLQSLLYDKLALPVQLNQQRKPTVDDSALARLQDEHRVVALLREQRGEEKVFNAFLTAALDQQVRGVIYPSFNVNGTVTGRISASSPNLQQLPSSGGIRSIYIANDGYSFISADYKQLEVTLAAHFSRDPNLLRVVNEGISLHDLTAEGVGCERSKAKTLNFAIQYGAGAKKVKKILQCSDEEAEAALRRYWQTYPGLKGLIDRCHRCVDLGKSIQNPFGRQRRLKALNPSDKWEVAGVKRQAFNSLIQGTGADLTNLAFIQAAKEIRELGHGRALFVVHDEIILEVHDAHVLYWNKRLPEIMAQVGLDKNLTVALLAEASGGSKFWQD